MTGKDDTGSLASMFITRDLQDTVTTVTTAGQNQQLERIETFSSKRSKICSITSPNPEDRIWAQIRKIQYEDKIPYVYVEMIFFPINTRFHIVDLSIPERGYADRRLRTMCGYTIYVKEQKAHEQTVCAVYTSKPEDTKTCPMCDTFMVQKFKERLNDRRK